MTISVNKSTFDTCKLDGETIKLYPNTSNMLRQVYVSLDSGSRGTKKDRLNLFDSFKARETFQLHSSKRIHVRRKVEGNMSILVGRLYIQ